MKAFLILLLVVTVLLGEAECFAQSIVWNGNGDGTSWSDANNWSGQQVPGSANDAIITNGNGGTVIISSGVTVASLACNKALVITNGSLTVTAGFSLVQGALTVSDGCNLSVSGSGTTLTSDGPVNITGANLYASGGAELSLPGLSHYEPPSVCEIITWKASGAGSTINFPALTNVTGNIVCSFLYIQATSGGQVLLGKVAADYGGDLSASADGSNSLVDLSSLAGNAGTMNVEASGGGSLLIPQLAESGVLNLTLGADGFIPTAQLTNITGASFYANGGAVISLPGVVNYQPPGACEGLTWQANGTGSTINFPALTNVTGTVVCSELIIQAVNGGQVLLSNAVADLGGVISVRADGSNSLVDLSSLAGNAGTMNVEASGGGSLLIPQLAESGVLNLTLGTGGFIPTAQLTNITGASFYANDGAVISLPGVMNYQPPAACYGLMWQASGTGGKLIFPALTNVTGTVLCSDLNVQALNGGQVSLNKAVANLGGVLTVEADGSNSVVSLPLLATNAGALNLEASGGGSVLMPHLANGGNINLNLGADGFISTAQLTNITGANFTVSGGAVMSLPGVVNYQPPTACESIAWQVSGAGSELSLPALTNLTGNLVCGLLTVKALSGGQVLLGNVQDVHNGYMSFLSDGTGSVINLSKMSGMVLVNGQGSLTAQNGGAILLNNQAFLLANVAINITATNSVLPPTVIPSQALTLYGTPWHSYQVQERNTLDPGSPWVTFLVPLTNNFQAIAASPPANTAFIVTDFVANPDLLQLSLSRGQVQVVLYAETNLTFKIESSTNLLDAWTTVSVATMTNVFRILPTTPQEPAAQFFRAQQQ